MDLSKIKSYHLRKYDDLTEDEKKKFQRNPSSYLGGYSFNHDYKIFHEDVEPLLKVPYYFNIMPFGKIDTNYLLKENKTTNRYIEEIIEQELGVDQEHALRISQMYRFSSQVVKVLNNLQEKDIFTERPLVDLFVLNEFLHQEEIENYKEFIEQKFDEIYDEKYMNLDLTFGEYTKRIINIVFNEDFSYCPCLYPTGYSRIVYKRFILSASNPHLMSVFEKISRTDMEKIIQKYDSKQLYSSVVTGSALNKKLDGYFEKLKEYEKTNDDSVSKDDIVELMVKTFTYLLEKENDNVDFAKINNYSYTMSLFKNVVADDFSQKGKTTVYPEKAYKLFKKIYDNKDHSEMTIKNYILFIGGLRKPYFVSEKGTTDELVDLMYKILNFDDGFDKLVDVMNLFEDTIMLYDGPLSNIKEWNDFADSDDADFAIDYSLIYSIMIQRSSAFNKRRGSNDVLRTIRTRMI